MTERVQPGVFFQPTAALPRGRHGLPREEVRAAQCERLMAALTELMAERGYGSVRVGDIASRAGVSHAAFYDLFADKEECALAAYDRFISVIMTREREGLASSANWGEFVRRVLEAYFGSLEDDLVAARAFQIEMDALGSVARFRRRKALQQFSEMLFQSQKAFLSREADLRLFPIEIHLAIAYAVRQLASDALDTARTPDLRGLVPTLVNWILDGAYAPRGQTPGRQRRAARTPTR